MAHFWNQFQHRFGKPTPKVDVTLGMPDDDAELRRLLRETPMPGAVSLTLEREPRFALGMDIEGDRHCAAVARDRQTQRLVGLGSMSSRSAWVNGTPQRVGYLSQLRVEPGYRGTGSILARGYRVLREQHEAQSTEEQDRALYYVTTIFESNRLARIVLEQDRSWKPNYRRHGRLSTLALPLWRRRSISAPPGVELVGATEDQLDDIVQCLSKNGARYQFTPHWTAADLLDESRTRGLAIEDFFIALRKGQVIGCVALWDQSQFKQTVVHGYSRAMTPVRALVNVSAQVAGWPRLPRPGQHLRHAYLSHLALNDDDREVGCALLATAMNASLGRGYHYLTTGFEQRHPLLRTVTRKFRHIEYRSLLYLAFWEDGTQAVRALDDRIPHLEVAVL